MLMFKKTKKRLLIVSIDNNQGYLALVSEISFWNFDQINRYDKEAWVWLQNHLLIGQQQVIGQVISQQVTLHFNINDWDLQSTLNIYLIWPKHTSLKISIGSWLRALTSSHPHRETYPGVSTQLKHQVNVDKYA